MDSNSIAVGEGTVSILVAQHQVCFELSGTPPYLNVLHWGFVFTGGGRSLLLPCLSPVCFTGSAGNGVRAVGLSKQTHKFCAT